LPLLFYPYNTKFFRLPTTRNNIPPSTAY